MAAMSAAAYSYGLLQPLSSSRYAAIALDSSICITQQRQQRQPGSLFFRVLKVGLVAISALTAAYGVLLHLFLDNDNGVPGTGKWVASIPQFEVHDGGGNVNGICSAHT